MNTADAIRQRRAVKHFDPAHEMPKETFDELMDLALQSPTSFNIQQWRFVLVEDKDLRAQVRAAGNDQAQLTEASLLFVLCADVKAWQKEPQRYWRNAPKEVQDILVPWMGPFYEGKDRLQRDEAMRSVGIAAQTMMLAAKSLGYDSCPMIGFDADKVGELIGVPDDHAVGMIVVIGKGIKPAWPKPGQLGIEEVLVRNKFGA